MNIIYPNEENVCIEPNMKRKQISVFPNRLTNTNSKNGRKRSISYETKASQIIYPSAEKESMVPKH